MQASETIWDRYSHELWAAGGAAVTWFLTHLLRKYRNRMTVVRGVARYQSIGVSGEDSRFGSVEILWNKNAVRNLQTCLVQLENESNRDLTDIEINLFFTDGTVILIGLGALEGSSKMLPLAGAWETALSEASNDEDEDDPPDLFLRRDFLIPVLNRGCRANFMLLLSTPTKDAPQLNMACEHPGVRLVQQSLRPIIWGVPLSRAIVVGFVVALGLVVVVGFGGFPLWVAIAIAFLLGSASTAVGVGMLRLQRAVGRFLG